MSDEKKPDDEAATDKKAKVAADGSGITDRLRSLNLITMVGVLITVGYVASFMFQNLLYSWWLMIGMPAAAGFLFWTQRQRTDGFEAQVCKMGLWAVLGLFIIRDAIITAQRTVLPEGILFVQ